MTMNIITVNGERRQIAEGLTLAGLLTELEIDRARTVVEKNGGIVERDNLGNTIISEGDTIEIVRFVGGG
jgi:sulfur carrier protein